MAHKVNELLSTLGSAARDKARQQTLELLESNGPGLDKTIKTLNDAMSASTQKVFFKHNSIKSLDSLTSPDNQDNIEGDNRLVYSDAMVDHATRLKAVQLAFDLYDVMPNKRSEIAVTDELTGMNEDELDAAIKAFNDKQGDGDLSIEDLLG